MIVYRGTRQDLLLQVAQLSAILSGRAADATGIAKAFLMAIGYAALADIRDAYVKKARGGTDAMGVRWAPLRPRTIANRRVGPGDRNNANVQAWEQARKRELRRIQREFERQEGDLYDRFLLSMDAAEARRRARQIASRRATEQTGMTKIQALGSRNVEILRDTGVLMNSLTPGVLSASGSSMTYSPPSGEGGQHQVFKIGPGEVIVGTIDKKAATHQNGDPARNIPQRKILPEESDTIPADWMENWIDAGKIALVAAAGEYFRRGNAA